MHTKLFLTESEYLVNQLSLLKKQHVSIFVHFVIFLHIKKNITFCCF
jgi:hypothetical protein